MATKPRSLSPWIHHWEHPLAEIPSLVHFNEAQAHPGLRLPPHTHSSFELCYIVDGRARWQNTDGGFDLGPGDLYLTLPDEEHDGVADQHDPHHNFAIGFDLRVAAARLGDPGLAAQEACSVDAILPRQRVIKGGHSTQRIWTALKQELQDMPAPGAAERGLAIAMVQALLVELAVAVTRLSISASRTTIPHQPKAEDLQAVRTRLAGTLEEPPTLSEMASWVGLSPGHFAVLFKRTFGCTPHEYLTELRIDAAAARLRSHPDQAITSIALDFGFCSSQYFSEVFRRLKGVSPSQWRTKI